MKKDKVYAVLNEDRGGDTLVTIHRTYKSAKKKFDEIVKDAEEALANESEIKSLNFRS